MRTASSTTTTKTASMAKRNTARQTGFIQKEGGSLLTPEFRVSFPNIFTPSELDGKYSCVMIFDHDTDFSELEALVEETIAEKWPKDVPSNLALPILDGGDSDRPETDGKFYINGKCGKFRPGLVDANKAEIGSPEEFYPGCYARAVITCYAWSFKGKNGVSVNIRNIQKLRDGEPLVSRVRAENDFDNVKSEDDL
jgi:hypothetical protein